MFSQRLKSLRQAKGMTQKQIAAHFNITERGYQRYENGSSTPHFETLIKLADFFYVSIDYLVGRTEKEEVNK